MLYPILGLSAVAIAIYQLSKMDEANDAALKALQDLAESSKKGPTVVGGCSYDPSPMLYTNRFGSRSPCVRDPSPLPPSLLNPPRYRDAYACSSDPQPEPVQRTAPLPPPIQDRSGQLANTAQPNADGGLVYQPFAPETELFQPFAPENEFKPYAPAPETELFQPFAPENEFVPYAPAPPQNEFVPYAPAPEQQPLSGSFATEYSAPLPRAPLSGSFTTESSAALPSSLIFPSE